MFNSIVAMSHIVYIVKFRANETCSTNSNSKCHPGGSCNFPPFILDLCFLGMPYLSSSLTS
uniref:Uncharacterized protein n=1 Tax=Arundo donax TaxID=35708 RepID=A0A0A9DH12_ARUDO